MKAFEKWWDNNWWKCGYANNVDAKKVWEGALKWIRDRGDSQCCGKWNNVGDWIECPRDTLIRQELEEK
jgi:hypothetical protein